MRRIALLLALLLALVVPSATSAATTRCTVDISPAIGSTTGVYRITVSGVPVDPDGGSVEVRVDVKRLGSRDGSVYFAFLFPGTTQFYIDHNLGLPGEPPNDPLVPGRYRVFVSTPHIEGPCHTTDGFVVAA